MTSRAIRAVRFVSGSLFVLTAIGVTGTAIAQTVAKSSTKLDVEEIYIARSIPEAFNSPTAFCAESRTGFDNTFIEGNYTFQSTETRGADGLMIDTNVQTIGRIHTCFGRSSDAAVMTFYGEGALGTVTFTGRGDCRTAKNNYPEQGMKVMRCFLDLSDVSGGRVGGQLTTNTMNSRNPYGDKTDPLGYTQSSIATIRLWKPR